MNLIAKIIKALAQVVAILVVLMVVYSLVGIWDVNKVDKFCSEMTPGLDINKVHVIAEKYDVGFKYVRDPNAVKNQTLGTKVTDKENIWLFSVAAPMTMGEHACVVYHDYRVVLSAKSPG